MLAGRDGATWVIGCILICIKHSFAFRPKNLVFFQKFSGFITRLLANTRHDIMFDLGKSGFYVATLPKRPNL
uniref:Uncharacterized protein n=1 Tax=Anguilla anguilla TaxID=7936 RepID=A0A0E9UDH4_ANGAN